jgi:acetate---CoA ligase (ADP-forming)
VFGIPGFTSCTAIGEPVDAAFLMLPRQAVIGALEDAAAAGIRLACVLSSGYAETGPEGIALQEELVARAKELGITVWGPNALGFVNLAARTLLSTMSVVEPLLPPSVAIVTQSGASAIELNEYAHTQNIGTSFLAAIGNEAMVGVPEVIEYLVDAEHTKAIAVFCESIGDTETFAKAAARARQAKKPVVIFKIGRTQVAKDVARAHTGADAGDDAAFDALCEEHGVIRVHAVEDMIVTAGLIAATGPLEADGLSFMSVSGGACTIVADRAEGLGVSLPPHDAETAAKLRETIGDFGAAYNPLDVTGTLLTTPELFGEVVPLATASPEFGLVAVNIIVPTMEHQGLPAALPPLARALARVDKPVIIMTLTTKTLNDYTRKVLAEHGLPYVVTSLEQGLKAIARLTRWSRRLAGS